MNEQQALTVVADSGVATQQQPDSLAMILRAAQDPQTDTSKLESLVGLYERMQDRTARERFNAAMVACQAEMPRVKKDGKVINHKTGTLQSRYATFERIDDCVRPICERHGFSISVSVDGVENGKYNCRATVRHSGGHSEEYRMPLALDQSGAKNDTQGMGSTMAYARRYLLKAIFNIVEEGEDNDGQVAEPCITQDQQDTLTTLLEGRDRAKFYAYVSKQAGREITTLAQIPVSLFPSIMQAFKGGGK